MLILFLLLIHLSAPPTNGQLMNLTGTVGYCMSFSASMVLGGTVHMGCPGGMFMCTVDYADFGHPTPGTCDRTRALTATGCSTDVSGYVSDLCLGQQSCDLSWHSQFALPSGVNGTCDLTADRHATVLVYGECCPHPWCPWWWWWCRHHSKSNSRSASHSLSHRSHSRSKSHHSRSHRSRSHHSKSHHSKSHHSKSHRSRSESKSHHSHSHRSQSHHSHSHHSESKSHHSKSHNSKSHHSHSHSKSQSHSRSQSHRSPSHYSASHYSKSYHSVSASNSKSHASHSESHSLSHASHSVSHSKSHASHSESRSQSHASHSASHSKSHASESDSQSKSHASESVSHSKSHNSGSDSQSKSHESESDSHSASHVSHSTSRSKSHASQSTSHSLSHKSHSRSTSASHRSRSRSDSGSRSASHRSETASHSSSHRSRSASHRSQPNSASRHSHSHRSQSASHQSHSQSESQSRSMSTSYASEHFEHNITNNVDVCVSETTTKDPGVNTTFTCPAFSVFCSVLFSAVGVPTGINTCDGGTANFTINSCGYNLTLYMATKCVGQPSCNFTAQDLSASGFVDHECPAYNASLYMTFGFFGTCCHPQVLCPIPHSHEWNLLKPSRAVALDGAVALQMAGDSPSCDVQLRVEHNLTALPAYSELGIVVNPAQLLPPGVSVTLLALSVHIVIYLAPDSAARLLSGEIAPYLEYVSGCSATLATDPRNVVLTPPSFFDQFGYQCPQSYARELPNTPATEFYTTFFNLQPAVFSNASSLLLALVLPDLGPDDYAYVGEVTVFLLNNTAAANRFYRLINGSPCLNNTLAAYTCTCAAPCAAQRYVATDVLVDSGQPLLRGPI